LSCDYSGDEGGVGEAASEPGSGIQGAMGIFLVSWMRQIEYRLT